MSDTSNAMGEQVLLALGLDMVCVQVYLTMHAVPTADTVEIANRLSLEISEVVDALDELADLTLLRPGLAPSGRLRPVSIERALHTLLRQQAEQLKAQTNALSQLQSAVTELLASRPARSDSFGQVDVETITGDETIQQRLEELGMRATQSVYSLLPGGPQPREVLDAARPFDGELSERGVHVRAIYQTSIKSDRRNMEYARWLSGLGAEVRCAPVIPVRVLLIDNETAVLGHRQAPLPYEMFVIREPGILAPLIALFDISWNAAEPLDLPDAKSEETEAQPTAQELALLRLLAVGSTDEAVGKKLGVSVRTVRRIMADLMERLGASSRFEAGHKATQRGWL
ncbi:MAG TPA: LuxR C-terminal-related transcriptional regulator [Actinospica sp.]|jgi:DNA-binding CsgD family transcriptional regulator|nr:LuxR C-terminal-related transcriptional regulator [Actinospica sp.]